MKKDGNDIKNQFNGFVSTRLLWKNDDVAGLRQFDLKQTHETPIDINKTPRLGKLTEQFVFHQLGKINNCQVIIKNTQIQRDKITIGEIDCVLKQNEQIIHLEMIYKFYLYDDKAGKQELDKWIGPNKKDSLNQKLKKLTSKQLPRLFLPESIKILSDHNLKVDNVLQRVNFKAQLFTPISSKKIVFDTINEKCVAGFYVNYKDLSQFRDNTFFLPQKLDWLSSPIKDKDYVDLQTFKKSIERQIKESRSPLCWMKTNENKYKKFFVVWW
ncbi:MAG: DUF1853 family protein [Flavobacteriales bacterium]|nr:DUF1853 family protein [Flavobacteriales bacterium]